LLLSSSSFLLLLLLYRVYLIAKAADPLCPFYLRFVWYKNIILLFPFSVPIYFAESRSSFSSTVPVCPCRPCVNRAIAQQPARYTRITYIQRRLYRHPTTVLSRLRPRRELSAYGRATPCPTRHLYRRWS